MDPTEHSSQSGTQPQQRLYPAPNRIARLDNRESVIRNACALNVQQIVD